MADPIVDTLKAAVQALRATPAIVAYVGPRIYDRVPQDPKPTSPYISLGPHDATTEDEHLADCIDGVSLAFQIDVWSWGASDAHDRIEASDIAHQVRQALHRRGMTIGGQHVDIHHRQTRLMGDPAGGYHAVMAFEADIPL